MRTLTDFKKIGSVQCIGLSLFLSLLSLGGVPPLSGFSVKFLTFMYICLYDNYYILAYFVLLNFFFLFFYIQNIRSLTASHETEYTFYYTKNSKAYLHQPLVTVLLLLNVFNIVAIFFLEDLVLYINFMFSFFFYN